MIRTWPFLLAGLLGACAEGAPPPSDTRQPQPTPAVYLAPPSYPDTLAFPFVALGRLLLSPPPAGTRLNTRGRVVSYRDLCACPEGATCGGCSAEQGGLLVLSREMPGGLALVRVHTPPGDTSALIVGQEVHVSVEVERYEASSDAADHPGVPAASYRLLGLRPAGYTITVGPVR